jgi:hypothetical protein
MNYRRVLLSLAVLMALAQAAFAQTTGTCGKADVAHDIPAGDREGHFFGVAQGQCKAHIETNGVSSESATYSVHREITTISYKAWGIYVENYENGDKIAYSYVMTLPIKNGTLQPGKSTYRAIFGTGKMKGIKTSGQCTYIPHPDKSVDYRCDKSGAK